MRTVITSLGLTNMISAGSIMSQARKCIISLLLLVVTHTSYSMVYDNRFIPLLQHPYISIDGRPSHAAAYLFATTASKALDNREKTIGIPEISGELDLGKLGQALTVAGFANPLRSDLIGTPIPIRVNGSIQTQGIEFSYYQSICDIIGFGFDWFAMRSNSSQEFRPEPGKLNFVPGIENSYIDQVRREMFETIGLNQAHAAQSGMGDLDLYFNVWHYWDYVLKMKRIDAAVRFGGLMPTGVKTKVNSPASIPFGGNGFWGFYGQLNAEFELKEDIKVGLFTRLSKRFKQVQCQRLPVNASPLGIPPTVGEPQIFGATVGDVLINPGLTFVFSPYFTLENLAAGCGARVEYFYTKHRGDCWTDARKQCDPLIPLVPVNLSLVNANSEWKTDYVTVSVFYDFGKMKVNRSADPIVIFAWDIPSLFFGSERAVNAHKLSLGLEVNF